MNILQSYPLKAGLTNYRVYWATFLNPGTLYRSSSRASPFSLLRAAKKRTDKQFLVTCTRLYKPLCRSVRRSFRPSVRRCSRSTRLMAIGLVSFASDMILSPQLLMSREKNPLCAFPAFAAPSFGLRMILSSRPTIKAGLAISSDLMSMRVSGITRRD